MVGGRSDSAGAGGLPFRPGSLLRFPKAVNGNRWGILAGAYRVFFSQTGMVSDYGPDLLVSMMESGGMVVDVF